MLEERAIDRRGVGIFVNGLDQTGKQIKILRVVDFAGIPQPLQFEADGITAPAVAVGKIIASAAAARAVMAINEAVHTG